MKLRVLIVGYGSIGKRHANIISKMSESYDIYVVTSQENIPFKIIDSINKAVKLNPDYIIISSPTILHFEQLRLLDKNLKGKKILIEKPLYEKHYQFVPENNLVYVAYMLRFHPIIQFIKTYIKNVKIWNVNIFCGSYLPDWRPERDYRKIYSAQKESGGGVLLDLSHEIDYVQYIFGNLNIDYAFNGKISDLEIDSDDFVSINASNKEGVKFQIVLNYFTRSPIRKIIIDGEGIGIQADLNQGSLIVNTNNGLKSYDWSKEEKDRIYLKQHQAVLGDDKSTLCSFKQGLEIMEKIDQVRELSKA